MGSSWRLVVSEIGRSKPGDKTLLDALQPAADAARSTVATTGDAISVLTAAAAAADRGAASTADMRAMTGRARYAATGAIGTLDPGAVAIAHMFRAWADAVDHGAVPRAEGVLGASGNSRARRLDRLATETGQFAILALDHVRSFATTLRPDDPEFDHGRRDTRTQGAAHGGPWSRRERHLGRPSARDEPDRGGFTIARRRSDRGHRGRRLRSGRRVATPVARMDSGTGGPPGGRCGEDLLLLRSG